MKKGERKKLLASLALGERFCKASERICPERKGYSSILSDFAKKFSDALEKKDFARIFNLESIVQEHDANFRTPEQSKPREIVGVLPFLAKRFHEFSNPENVRKHFLPTISKLNNASGIKDNAFSTPINSMCGYINSMKSSYCPPAVNGLLSIRVKCLSAAKEEHQKNINIALGFEPKERGHSR